MEAHGIVKSNLLQNDDVIEENKVGDEKKILH